MIPASAETIARIEQTFPVAARREVKAYLCDECGDNLPLVATECVVLAERIRFAVIKLSGGNLSALKIHVTQAKRDWRDTLVAAGFAGSITAHLDWYPDAAC